MRRLAVTYTKTLVVDLPDDEAAALLAPSDAMDVYEAADRFRRQAHNAAHNFEHDLSIKEASSDSGGMWDPSALDVNTMGPGFLWSARHFVGEARAELNRGRYREGHCPDLDAVNVELGRLEERLRLMALDADRARVPA